MFQMNKLKEKFEKLQGGGVRRRQIERRMWCSRKRKIKMSLKYHKYNFPVNIAYMYGWNIILTQKGSIGDLCFFFFFIMFIGVYVNLVCFYVANVQCSTIHTQDEITRWWSIFRRRRRLIRRKILKKGTAAANSR